MVKYKIVSSGLKKSYFNYLEKKKKFKIMMDIIAESLGGIRCDFLEGSELPAIIFGGDRHPINGGVRWNRTEGVSRGFRPTNSAAHAGIRKKLRRSLALNPVFMLGEVPVEILEEEGSDDLTFFYAAGLSCDGVEIVEKVGSDFKNRKKNGKVKNG